MEKVYVVCIDSRYLCDTMIFDSDGVPDTVLKESDLYDKDNYSRWGYATQTPPVFVDCCIAQNEQEAIEVVSMHHGIDKRILSIKKEISCCPYSKTSKFHVS